MTRPFSVVLLALLVACSLASPEAAVRSRLIAAGVKPHMAACLAPRLVAKLSRAQLETLGRLAGAPQRSGPAHRHSLGRLEDALAAVDDPQVADVVTRAAIGCAILG